MILTHDIGRSIELVDPALGLARWRYVYAGKPKPYVHPLRTPAGHCLTNFEPHDHLWHRGLWYTFKFINGENFWEEHEPYGTQRTRSFSLIIHEPGGRLAFHTALDWLRPGGEAVFHEERELAHEALGEEAYALDFATTLTAAADLTLDRTVFTTWGGYGGLILRGNRNWVETRLLFPDGSTSDRPTGVPALWSDLSGKLDGGPDQTGGVAIFDHPDNPRHPTPWYGATGSGHYVNAAVLFHEPLRVAAGETLRFRYRVLVHDGIWDAPQLQAAYESYAGDADH